MSSIGSAVFLVAMLTPGISFAQGKATLAREAAEYILKKFGREAAAESVGTLTRKLETLALKYGDDAFIAVKKVGPRAFRIVEETGEHSIESVKLMAKYGDDAIWVVAKPKRMAIFIKYGDNAATSIMKHGEIAEPLINSLGKPAVGALKAISPQNGRRLAIMAEDGQLAKIGRTTRLLDVVEKHGDQALDFIWRNKGSLAVGTALTAFLSNPEPFLNGASDITKIAAENVVRPIALVPAQVAIHAAKNTNWTFVAICSILVLGLLTGVRLWLKRYSNYYPGMKVTH